MCTHSRTAIDNCRFAVVLLFVAILIMLGCFEIFSWLDRNTEQSIEHNIFQSTTEVQ